MVMSFNMQLLRLKHYKGAATAALPDQSPMDNDTQINIHRISDRVILP